MLKRRIQAVEKRLAGWRWLTKKDLRVVFQSDGDPEPPAGSIIFKMSRPRPPEGERVARFDFGDEGRAERPNEKTNDAAENSHPAETEKTRK